MTAFEDFVGLELPRRAVMTKGVMATGDPRLSALPEVVNAPTGTWYLQDDVDPKTIWRRYDTASTDWEPLSFSRSETVFWIDIGYDGDYSDGSILFPFTQIQQALNTIGEPIDLADSQKLFRIIVFQGNYDEDLTIPPGRHISFSSLGIVNLQDFSHATPRTITIDVDSTKSFGQSYFLFAIEPLTTLPTRDSSSLPGFRIDGGFIVNVINPLVGGNINFEVTNSIIKGNLNASSAPATMAGITFRFTCSQIIQFTTTEGSCLLFPVFNNSRVQACTINSSYMAFGGDRTAILQTTLNVGALAPGIIRFLEGVTFQLASINGAIYDIPQSVYESLYNPSNSNTTTGITAISQVTNYRLLYNDTLYTSPAVKLWTNGSIDFPYSTPVQARAASATAKIKLLGFIENADVDTGTETVDEFADTVGSSVLWDVQIKKGANVQRLLASASWDATGNTISPLTTSVVSTLGTIDVTLSCDISSDNVRLRATATSDNWSVKVVDRTISS